MGVDARRRRRVIPRFTIAPPLGFVVNPRTPTHWSLPLYPRRARPLPWARALLSQQLLHRNRQITNALSCRMIDGVDDRRCYRDSRQLAHSLGTQWTCFGVELAREDYLQLGNVRVRGYEVAGVIAVKKPAHYRIGLRLLQQRLADAPDDSADRLTARGAGVNDPTGIIGADETTQTHEAEFLINLHFGEEGGEAEDRRGSLGLLNGIVIPIAD